MSIKHLNLFIVALAIMLISVTSAFAYDGPKMKFRLAHTTPPGNHITLAYQKFADLVKEKSNGKITVQVFPGAILGSDRVLVEGAQKGTLEIGVSSTPNLAGFLNDFSVFDLPYITSPKFQNNLYASINPGGALNEYFAKASNSIGLQPIMYAEYGYRHFVSIERPMKTVTDLAGLKMRTTDSPVEVAVAKALNTNPSPIAWGEVYTALQQKTIDAEGNTLPHLFGAKHNEVLKYVITSAHNYGMQVAMANKAWWDGLSPEVQTIINDAALEAVTYQREVLYPENEKTARQGFVDSGITIYDPTDEELDEFKKLTRPVWDSVNLPDGLVQLVLDTQR